MSKEMGRDDLVISARSIFLNKGNRRKFSLLTLTGGGALLKNIDKRLSKETGLPVHIADDPLACVAIGTGKALDQEETFSSVLSEY